MITMITICAVASNLAPKLLYYIYSTVCPGMEDALYQHKLTIPTLAILTSFFVLRGFLQLCYATTNSIRPQTETR